ncbi:MAG TPA: TrkA C-terminal domain-containing protein [Gaiellaceae bacterium]|nr:TrkA C-terminal domain-containing protein [Gaiellaceae bacterium]
MIALVSLFVIIVGSMIVVRIATAMLVLTGLSPEVARFQARSALTGVGFTTSEAESVVGHPVRRKIVMTLMLIGSAGVITAVATLMLSFVGAGGGETAVRATVLLAGLLALLLLTRSRLVDRALSRAIQRGLRRWTTLDLRDWDALLHLGDEYAVSELHVADDSWLAGRTLDDLSLRSEGIRVLGIARPDGTYFGAPIGTARVAAGDIVVVYGKRAAIEALGLRPAGPEGDAEHARAAAALRASAPAPAEPGERLR